jgi:peptidoglycan/LPS O-acetylase OafA/YrhL
LNPTSDARSTSLDILRIFAAAWVMTFHWAGNGGFYPLLVHKYATNWLPTGFTAIGHYGFLGVDVFFMLSGAVIAHTALSSSWHSFSQRRFLRLAPSYVLATVLALVVVPLAVAGINRWVSLVSLTGIHFYIGGYNIVGTAWTLAIEVQFYAYVALWVWMKKSLNEHQIAVGAYWLLLASVVAPHLNQDWITWTSLSPWGTYFALGALISVSGSKQAFRAHAIGIIVAASAAGITLYNRISQQWPGINPRTAVLVALAVLLACGAVLTWSSFRASRLASRTLKAGHWTRPITTLSLMTYPFYLFHEVIGMSLIAILVTWGCPPSSAFFVILAAVILASWLSVKWYDPISRRILRRLLGWGAR